MARRSGAVCDHCWFDERQRRGVLKMCNVQRGVFLSVEVFGVRSFMLICDTSLCTAASDAIVYKSFIGCRAISGISSLGFQSGSER